MLLTPHSLAPSAENGDFSQILNFVVFRSDMRLLKINICLEGYELSDVKTHLFFYCYFFFVLGLLCCCPSLIV